MFDLTIPAAPEAVTPEWLTQALSGTGTITEARIESFSIERIGEGKSFTAHVALLRLRYDVDEKDAPRSLVAKFPASSPRLRAILNGFRLYEREIRFYREIAVEASFLAPRCYYSALDVQKGRSILLIEDFTQARVGSILEGCSREDAQYAIGQLAKFHAAWWDNPRLDHIAWMPTFSDTADSAQELYRRLWVPYREIVRGSVPPSFIDLGDRLWKNVAAISRRLAEPPRTILHGDCRLENLLFGVGEPDPSLTIIDWQAVTRGRGVSDVTYFLVYCLNPAQRREWESDLLRVYHSALLKNGVFGYEFKQCLQDYKLSILHLLYRGVVGASLLDFSGKQEQDFRETVRHRCAVAIDDHNVAEMIQ